MRVTLDANCFIDATNPGSHAFTAMEAIAAAWRGCLLEVGVSRHTLAELERKPDAALELARRCVILPHYPIGTWDDQVSTWDQPEGTWDDVATNNLIQESIALLAKAGNDIRDRGAYLDALRAGVYAFVTSDNQLVGGSPAARIEAEFGVRVMTPQDLAAVLQPQGSNPSVQPTRGKDARG